MTIDQDAIRTATSRIDNSKDWAMTRVMADFARTTPQKNLTPVEIKPATRRTRLALVMLPEWGVWFPPYNVSRLSSVARAAGYETHVFDINVKAWRATKDIMPFDAWDPSKEWMWVGKWYHKELHRFMEPVLNEYKQRLIDLAPDVIGFSMYYTNEQPSNWLARELRKALPNTKLIVGGPQAPVMAHLSTHSYDHIVEGEGEQVLLDILNRIELGEPIGSKKLSKNSKLRIDLDSLPFPDYSDYDMGDYIHPGGMSSEISRGCVAKCVFCTEVHFWKYRGRVSSKLLDEIIHQNRTYSMDFVWFIDSLVNGNLRELRAFALGVVEAGLKIRWQGYARCDGRMDAEYFQDLAASGCVQLNYGVESGSQRVLDAMKKEITLDEVESNLRDGAAVGIEAHTNWIVGFPNEDASAFSETLTLIWRIRHYRVLTISPGLSLMLSPGSDITLDPAAFGIADGRSFLNMWTTQDLSNTKLHRLIRQKTMAVFLEHLHPKKPIFGFDRPRLKETYEITYDRANIKESIPRETFDYQIIKPGKSSFQDTVVNEIWPLLRTLWRALGPYEINLRFDPEWDLMEFGDRLGCDYTAAHEFRISESGDWTAKHYYKFVHKHHDGTKDGNWPDSSFEYNWNGIGNWSLEQAA
jgi:hypothetical protein